MVSGIKLRKFKLSDLDSVLKIETGSFSAAQAYSKRRFACLYSFHPNNFIVAEKTGKIVGYIIAYNNKGFLDFNSIAVDKNYRNLGIGRRLMNVFLRKSKKDGLKKACLEVKITNKKAVSFYKKLGFEIKKTLKRFYKDGRNAYRMEMPI